MLAGAAAAIGAAPAAAAGGGAAAALAAAKAASAAASAKLAFSGAAAATAAAAKPAAGAAAVAAATAKPAAAAALTAKTAAAATAAAAKPAAAAALTAAKPALATKAATATAAAAAAASSAAVASSAAAAAPASALVGASVAPAMAARYEGWLSAIADPLEDFLLFLQEKLRAQGVPFPQGTSIVALTACVKLATFPFTKKQVESGMAMQNLQPQVKALRERWAGDENSQKLNSELNALYQRFGVNPLAGCFPVLLTLPVFWGLYRALLNGSADGAFKEQFWWVPSLAGPTYDKFPGNTVRPGACVAGSVCACADAIAVSRAFRAG